jgi:galactonate dehydratase
MKITEIRTYLVNANEGKRADRPRGRNWLFCKVLTDEGIYGVGEGGGWPAVAQKGIEEVAPLLLGEDPFAIERLWLVVYDLLHGHGLTGSVRGGVISAIDMALWDIKGKALGVPIYELLGGKVRDRIRIYAHANSVARGRELVERGYTAFKCGPDPQQLIDMRAALGYEVEIGVHCHGEFSPGGALQLAKAIEPYEPAFLEEPTTSTRCRGSRSGPVCPSHPASGSTPSGRFASCSSDERSRSRRSRSRAWVGLRKEKRSPRWLKPSWPRSPRTMDR